MYTKTDEGLIHRSTDGAWIPFDLDNTDFQALLAYLAENNLQLNDLPDYVE